MKFFIAILGLTTIVMLIQKVASDDSSEPAEGKEYHYTLPISVVMEIEAANKIIDASGWLDDQTVVYNRKVDKAHPIYLTGNVVNHRFRKAVAVFPSTNILYPCSGSETGTWEGVIVQTVLQSLTPNGGCPIDEGKYTLDAREGYNISTIFRDVLDCGLYEINVSLIDEEYKAIMQVKYAFDTADFEDQSTCI